MSISIFMKLLKLKDINIAQWLIVMVMFGFFVVAIVPNEIFGIKLKKTMPKTYEYVKSNVKYNNFYTVGIISDNSPKINLWGSK